MKTTTTLLIFLLVFISSINDLKAVTKSNETETESRFTAQQDTTTLIIEGNNIWVRNEPRTGEVVFTLNEGSICKVLEKGEKQTIRENEDFWYKIEYEGKIGWVFGSQTSIRNNPAERFEDFLDGFISAIESNDASKIQNFVSPIHGFDYSYMDCKTEGMGVYETVVERITVTNHYSQGSDLIDIVNQEYYLFEIKSYENDFSLIELENGMMQIEYGEYKKDDCQLQFRLVEGKWYLASIANTICIEDYGV